MRLEDQVSNLKLSKRLKELGVKQRSLFCWHLTTPIPFVGDWPIEIPEGHEWISAFTVAELGEMIHYDAFFPRYLGGSVYQWAAEFGHPKILITGTTEADTRAKVIIHLIEKGIVKP